MEKEIFDLIVLGAGTAGLTVANKCRSVGLSVAIILILKRYSLVLQS
ncbi:MAG: FAD-binding protein [Bacteriovoracaceae bacterium]|nr:FAD-binding protein [Bacteriovoracaceae bacterium]